MTLPIVAVTNTLPDGVLDPLKGLAEVRVAEKEVTPAEVSRVVSGATAIVATLNEAIDAEVIASASNNLRIVANVAAGFDNLDVDAIHRAGAVVTNTPGVLADATADLTMALMLAVTRRLVEGDQLIRSGTSWKWDMDFLLGASLQGKSLGIVGMGEIGQAVVHRARAFGMNVLYLARGDRHVEDATPVTFDELLANSDVISLHCPLTAATHHLFDRSAFARMRTSAYLINTARGPVVDENALVEALKEGKIAGAALDVFEHEPAVTNALRALSNVVLCPHLGSATRETRRQMATLAVSNVVAVLKGDAPLTPVRKGI